jgi:antitoxin (DNA-binding transcriptional repressor) of toxin-antitoxin stability system
VDVTEEISQRELRNDSGRIMRGLVEGHSYIVTRNREPVGELRPLRRHRLVDARVVVELFRAAAPIDAGKLRDDLDRLVGQDIDPRG